MLNNNITLLVFNMTGIQTTIILTQEQFDELNQYSKETGNSRNSIVRTAIIEYFSKIKEGI